MSWSFGRLLNIDDIESDEIAASQAGWLVANPEKLADVVVEGTIQYSVDGLTALIDTVRDPNNPEALHFNAAGNLDELDAEVYYSDISLSELIGVTMPRLSPNTVSRNAVVTTLANSLVETTLYSYTIVGGSVVQDHGFHAEWLGKNIEASAVADSISWTWRVKLGASTLIATDSLIEVAAILTGLRHFTVDIFARAAPNDQIWIIRNSNGASEELTTGAVAVDMSVDQLFAVTVQMSYAHANVRATHELGISQIL